jgi:hypothetical protein
VARRRRDRPAAADGVTLATAGRRRRGGAGPSGLRHRPARD